MDLSGLQINDLFDVYLGGMANFSDPVLTIREGTIARVNGMIR